MDSPEIAEVSGYDQGFPAEDTDKDLCRICHSPEEPGNPLRFPCLCRGSMKYVHEECLLHWLNLRGYKKCEVCGRSYSFVPVYSENAPERLPCNEFLTGLFSRVSRYMKLIALWIVVILLNTYCCSLHPWGQEVVAAFQRGFWMSRKFASLLAGLHYCILIVCLMFIITAIRKQAGDLNVGRLLGDAHPANFIWNGLQQGVLGGVMQVLWKYTKILCDWFVLKLINFLAQRRRLIVVLRNAPLHEFGVLRRLLFFLDDDDFAVLTINLYVSILFVLLPLSIGSIVLATVGGSYFSGNSPVIFGYKMMLSIPIAYSEIIFTLHHNSFQAIVRWFLLGFHFIAIELPCLLWGFSVKASKNLSLIKDAFVFWFKFGVMPWIIGCWLKICISPMFGTTLSQRFEFFTTLPWLITLQWLVGFFCVMNADTYRKFLQEIIHKRAFWYLLDVTDLDYKITNLYLSYTFFAFASHGALLVISVHLPIKAIALISPSFFPLDLWVTDERLMFGAYAIYFNIMLFGPKWLIELTRPAIKLIVHNWIITVSSWLQLSDFLLVVPRGEGFQHADQNVRPLLQPGQPYDGNLWFLLYSIAEGSMVIHGSQNAEDDIKDQRDNRFMLRIASMLVLAAFSLFFFGTAFMALPILVGRVFFDSISFIMLRFEITHHDDFCGFWIGCCILRAIYIITCFVFDQIQKGRINLLLKSVLIWIRNGLMFSIWISVIPGLLGLLIDLMIIIPYQLRLNESPVYLMLQDWLIGVVVLHIWTFLTMLTPINWFATDAWRGKLERIRIMGINRLPSMWLLQGVIGSIISTLLAALSIPYLLVKSLFPLLGYSQSINSAVERFIWPALLALIAVWFIAKLTRDLIIYLHQLVFNERYLVGERVDNLTEDVVH